MIAHTEPRKLSVLLELCLHAKTHVTGIHYGLCTVADVLLYRGLINFEETKVIKDECMKLVSETRLKGDYGYVCLLRSALLQRLQGNHMDVDDLCYLIYSCWVDKLESEGK